MRIKVKKKNNREKLSVWLPCRCATGGIWFEKSWSGNICLILKTRDLGNASGFKLSEAVSSLCDNTTSASSARRRSSVGKYVVRLQKKRTYPGTQSALLATISSKLDTSKYLSVVVNPCEVSWREGEMLLWLMWQIAGRVYSFTLWVEEAWAC